MSSRNEFEEGEKEGEEEWREEANEMGGCWRDLMEAQHEWRGIRTRGKGESGARATLLPLKPSHTPASNAHFSFISRLFELKVRELYPLECISEKTTLKVPLSTGNFAAFLCFFLVSSFFTGKPTPMHSTGRQKT